MTSDDQLQANWVAWVHEHLGRDPERAAAAAAAGRQAMKAGKGIDAAYMAARTGWALTPPSGPEATKPAPASADGLLAEWRSAGLIDAATATRIELYESTRPRAGLPPSGINAAEVIAYIGSIVLLVGIGFLYGTEYEALGAAGRLAVIALVVGAGFAAGELVRLIGRTGAALRARSAGWAVAALGSGAWFAQAFADAHIGTRQYRYYFPGAPDDTSGAVWLGAVIGFAIAILLLWRAGAGLIAFAASALVCIAAGEFDSYSQGAYSPWQNESSWLVAGVALGVPAELLLAGHERRWAREILRFMAVVMPCLAALGFSNTSGGESLEGFGGLLAIAALALAFWRGSAGYTIGGGVALFAVVNEVGFRHFAESVGFPIVLIVSGITLFLIAGGLFLVLPKVRAGRKGS